MSDSATPTRRCDVCDNLTMDYYTDGVTYVRCAACDPRGLKTPTLRDRFAMAALVGIIAHPDDAPGCKEGPTVARAAYYYADAMLEAREVDDD